MEAIDNTVGSELPRLVFRKRIHFFTLATVVYDLLFGLRSRLIKIRPAPLPTRLGSRISAVSDRIAAGQVPDDVAKALRGAASDLASRRSRYEYVKRALTRT
jgi:hypothetical protein